MNKSESIKELAAALSKAQGEMPAAAMGSKNPFLKNKYANLGDIIKTAQPVLARHGLSCSQAIYADGPCIGVETILMHASGEWMLSNVSLHPGDEKGISAAQSAGKTITYLRRYALSAVLGMYADEDTDGNAAPTTEQAAQTRTPAAAPRPAPVDNIDADFPPVEEAAGTLHYSQAEYEAACEVTASDGVRYGDRETDKLVWVANNAKSPADKKHAASVIIEWRNSHK